MDMVAGIAIPLKIMSSSIGMITFPTGWENKNIPNNQPATVTFKNWESRLGVNP